jgi:hypothetical protein
MHEDLEQLVRRQLLAEPGHSLDRRVSQVCREPGDSTRRFMVGMALVAAGVLVAAMILPQVRPPTRPSATPKTAVRPVLHREQEHSQPIEVQQVWSRIAPGALLLTEDDIPIRPILIQRIQQTRWFDEKENVRMELTVPQEGIVFVTAPIQ